ncbi:flagellar protein FliT [Vibrio cincinnatiensis]|uniref:flagellar protein FliT n=1 Tax=Vibrio cincinnatiensis TaxID=675 RepID=UPI00389F8CC1
MQMILQVLCDINHQIKEKLMVDEINTEEIIVLVDKRETLLGELLSYIASNPQFAQSAEWQSAILETQHLVELMQRKTQSIGQALHKYRYGNKSVQQYKKFL